MNPLWVIGGVGVLAVGGAAFIAYRKEKAKPDTSSCGAVQSIVRTAFQFDIPPAACPAVDAALGIIGAALTNNERAKDAENIRLNGEIDIPLDAATKSIAAAWIPPSQAVGGGVSLGSGPSAINPQRLGGKIDQMLSGTVLRFKNGGVPFRGHPDFGKCVPGTHDMGASSVGGGAKFYILATAGRVPNVAQLADESQRNSFFRNEALYSKLLTGASSDPSTSLALGIVAGKKWVCPSGQKVIAISPVTDHRTDTIGTAIQVICGAPGATSSPPPPVGGSSSQPPGPAPGANYVWVPAVGTTPGHWERKRAA